MDRCFPDFTEAHYRRLIQLAKNNYSFISYSDCKKPGKNILWRHDIDMSVHRAVRLAAIEAEAGVSSTWFIHLHSVFYNPLEKQVALRIHDIAAMGHALGLHFDPDFYGLPAGRQKAFEEALLMEKRLLEAIFHQPVCVFSFHNPESGGWIKFEADSCAGMLNTYSAYFKSQYSYCSDSNGYWRFRRLKNVLEEACEEKLHILTHPEWWVPRAMPPRRRVSRAISGRARAQHEFYDRILAESHRENIGA